MEPYNKLSPAEAERLDYLTEEIGEVLQAVGKIKRHGYDSYNPDDPNHKGNKNDLERELNDLKIAILLLQFNYDIKEIIYDDSIDFEQFRSNKYFHHQ